MNSALATITAVRRVWRETRLVRRVGVAGMSLVSRGTRRRESPNRRSVTRKPHETEYAAANVILTQHSSGPDACEKPLHKAGR